MVENLHGCFIMLLMLCFNRYEDGVGLSVRQGGVVYMVVVYAVDVYVVMYICIHTAVCFAV